MEFFNDHVLCFSKIKGIVMSVEVDVKNTEVLLPEQLELTLLMWVFFLFLRLYTQDLVNHYVLAYWACMVCVPGISEAVA